MSCQDIFKDITNKRLISDVINELSGQFVQISKFELFDQFRYICFGKSKCKFNYGATEYLHHIQESIITYTRADGGIAKKLD